MTTHPSDRSLRMAMLKYAIGFGMVAVISGALGATHLSGATMVVTKLLLFFSLIICALLLTFAVIIGKRHW